MNRSPLSPLGRRGVSLPELMIVLLIAAVILGYGLPRFSGFLSYLTARSVAAQLTADLTLARTQAIRDGTGASLRITGANSYQVTTDRVDGTVSRVVKTVTLSGPRASATALSPLSGRVAFDPRGMRRTGTAGTVFVREGTRTDSIQVSLVGRVYRARR
jgi:prepilin-type N-terminal cleavage/methylation domain-containing protein